MTLSRDLAEHYATIAFAALPGEAIHAACISLADGLAVMLAATGLEPAAAIFADHALALGGAGEATLLGRAQKLPAPLAALANGALAHAVDFEDTFDATGVHPNAALIPAVLALAERVQADGASIVRALALGCDFTCRLSLALAGDPAGRGWYHPPMLGAMGATLGAAVLVGCTPAQIVDALSLAACQFSLGDELKRSPDSHLRAVRDGFAARAAVEAVLLARRGVRGVEQPLEGKAGLFAVLTGEGPRQEPLLEGLGQRFLGTEVSIKRWPSCRGTHATIAAALALHEEGIAPEAIDAVSVAVSPPDDMLLVPPAQKQRPATAIDAKFSIPYTFAAALRDGDVHLGSFSAERLVDPGLLAIAARVSLAGVVTPGEEAITLVSRGEVRKMPLVLPPADRAGSMQASHLLAKMASCLRCASVQGPDAGALLEACLHLPQRGLGLVIAALGTAR